MKKILQAFSPKVEKTLAEMDLKQEPSFDDQLKSKAIGIKARIFRNKHPELQGKAKFEAGALISSRFVGKGQNFSAKFVDEAKPSPKSNIRVVHEGGVNFRALNVPQSVKDQLKETLAVQNAAEKKRIEALKQDTSVPPLSMARIDKIVEQARDYAQQYKGIKVSEASMEVIEISPSGKSAEISVYDKHQSRPNAARPVRATRVSM